VAQGLSGRAPRLLLILDRQRAGSDAAWLDRLEHLWPALPTDGSVWLQLRVKRLPHAQRQALLAAARGVTRLTGPTAPVLVNGTSGDALATGFTGVHWPESLRPEEPPPTAHRLTHTCAAVHDLAGARAAARSGASVVTFSPVHAPRSKPGEGVGLDALAHVCRGSPVPVIALGGITPERVQPCLRAGAHGVAVLSSISDPDAEPLQGMQALLQALGAPGV